MSLSRKVSNRRRLWQSSSSSESGCATARPGMLPGTPFGRSHAMRRERQMRSSGGAEAAAAAISRMESPCWHSALSQPSMPRTICSAAGPDDAERGGATAESPDASAATAPTAAPPALDAAPAATATSALPVSCPRPAGVALRRASTAARSSAAALGPLWLASCSAM
eukprot:scaffold10071_cov90-Isochrysis_galbana.AAC.1